MKQIQPIQIWVNGQEQTGNWINAYIINDNLGIKLENLKNFFLKNESKIDLIP